MYEERFNVAVNRTERFLNTKPLIECNEIQNHPKIALVEKTLMGIRLEPREVIGNCLLTSLKVKRHLEANNIRGITLTFGYVDTGYQRWIEFDELDVRNWSREPRAIKRNFHAWLTLPGMVVLDASLAATIQAHNHQTVTHADVVLASADDLPTWSYYPIFVGEQLAIECGLIDIS